MRRHPAADQTTRSVAPTAAGERLVAAIGPHLDGIDAELAALDTLRDKPAGTIHITTGIHAAQTILWPALSDLLPAYPDIEVEIAVQTGREPAVRVDGQVIVNDIALAVQAARDGVGIAYLPDDYATDDVIRKRLIRVLPGWFPPCPGYRLSYLSRRQLSLALLIAALRDRRASSPWAENAMNERLAEIGERKTCREWP